jgi:hypothetical protein
MIIRGSLFRGLVFIYLLVICLTSVILLAAGQLQSWVAESWAAGLIMLAAVSVDTFFRWRESTVTVDERFVAGLDGNAIFPRHIKVEREQIDCNRKQKRSVWDVLSGTYRLFAVDDRQIVLPNFFFLETDYNKLRNLLIVGSEKGHNRLHADGESFGIPL